MAKREKRTIAASAATTLVLVGALVSCATNGRPAERAAIGALLDVAWTYVHPDPTEPETLAYLAIRAVVLERLAPEGQPPQPTQWDAELAEMDAAMALYTAQSIYAPAVTQVDIPPIEPLE